MLIKCLDTSGKTPIDRGSVSVSSAAVELMMSRLALPLWAFGAPGALKRVIQLLSSMISITTLFSLAYGC